MLLLDYLNTIALPNPKIGSHHDVSKCFLKKEIMTLWDAEELVVLNMH